MSLRAIQFLDINRSLNSSADNMQRPLFSTRLQQDDDLQHVIMESTQHQATPLTGQPDIKQTEILRARPVFANSLLSTEVRVTVPISISAESFAPEITPGHGHPPQALDFACNNELFNRLHEPLPDYLGDDLYEAGPHSIVILDDENNLTNKISSIAATVLSDLHNGFGGKHTSQQTAIRCFIEGNNTRQTRDRPQQLGTLKLDFRSLAQINHRLNVISKADLVLCDCSGIVVDAIRSSVPAVFLTDIPIGFETLQYCVEAFLEHGNSNQLLEEQQNALELILENNCEHHLVMSNQNSLQLLVQDIINGVNLNQKTYRPRDATPVIQDDGDLILCTQQTLYDKKTSAVRLKLGLENSRRKYQKFRESPVRFLEESQSRVLRSLVSHRVQ